MFVNQNLTKSDIESIESYNLSGFGNCLVKFLRMSHNVHRWLNLKSKSIFVLTVQTFAIFTNY